ncbi:hypothetical protein F383_22973 [Gossypium arboreum]|uniref:Uncharacterized protein n=1 Tax=Gossypium arboreum TaxID=29729 RepID=A0A0B0NZQ4_GOSAR|nr:hypothetical protein F383_22973 [Gossypium arboreum]
MFKIELDKS